MSNPPLANQQECLLECLPPELLLSLMGASQYPLRTYVQLLGLSHTTRMKIRGAPLELSFGELDDATMSDMNAIPTPTTDVLAALVGPCKGLTRLSFPKQSPAGGSAVFGWGLTGAACAGWVAEAFGGHDRLGALVDLPSADAFLAGVELILGRLPGLAEVQLHADGPTQLGTGLLAALARCCPNLQALRSANMIFQPPDHAALAPLAGSLRQIRLREGDPWMSALVGRLGALAALDAGRCSPAALRPHAAHLRALKLRQDFYEGEEADLPPPELCRLERLSLGGPFAAPVARLLAANGATLRRLTLHRTSAPAGLVAALGALPHLDRLRLILPDAGPGVLSALPPALVDRLQCLTYIADEWGAEPRPVRIAGTRLRRLRLSVRLGRDSGLTVDCPALEELHLPILLPGQLTALRCPRLRLLAGLPGHSPALGGPVAPLPAGLEHVEGMGGTPPTDPVWLAPLLLAGAAPRLQGLSDVRLGRPDLLAGLCGCGSLTMVRRLALEADRFPRPLVLRLPGQLEHLSVRLLLDGRAAGGPAGADQPLVDMQLVEAPGLRSFGLSKDPDRLVDTSRLRLGACPRLEALALGLSGTVDWELADPRTALTSLRFSALYGSTAAASLLGCLGRHGARLRHLAVWYAPEAPAWPQLVAALCGLPRLASLELNMDSGPAEVRLCCPQLRTLVLIGMQYAPPGGKPVRRRLVLGCPLLEALRGHFNEETLDGLAFAPAAPANLRWIVGATGCWKDRLARACPGATLEG
ncbi:hypothetical protein PAPYR_4864 [Paratrimastix pyriformis]|uniref:Uncharacterized protein n=1 Tax=Paratrimastix pyriformis TaxID=342808 RepID=A0ABQ8UJA8_9EUKA|nr:hypothetical protein PAPYR_4864 [Paratrimastix pyriformis]